MSECPIDRAELLRQVRHLEAELVLERQKATLFHHRLAELARRWMEEARDAIAKAAPAATPAERFGDIVQGDRGNCAMDLCELMTAEGVWPGDR